MIDLELNVLKYKIDGAKNLRSAIGDLVGNPKQVNVPTACFWEGGCSKGCADGCPPGCSSGSLDMRIAISR